MHTNQYNMEVIKGIVMCWNYSKMLRNSNTMMNILQISTVIIIIHDIINFSNRKIYKIVHFQFTTK